MNIFICREKDELNESLIKLQASVTQLREKEAEASLKVKRSLDVVDQVQFEKSQVDSIAVMELSWWLRNGRGFVSSPLLGNYVSVKFRVHLKLQVLSDSRYHHHCK